MTNPERQRHKPRQRERKNIILVANPSHATPPEHAFWRQVAVQAKRHNWHLMQVATRALPDTKQSESISLPARLSDIFARLPMSASHRPEFVPWISANYLRILEDWEYRRWALKQRLPATVLGLLRLVDFVEDAMHLIQPSLVLTTNKIDHGVTLFREASLYHGTASRVVERSPLDSIWLEPAGLFGESLICSLYEVESHQRSATLTQVGESHIAKMVENPHGFRAATGSRALPRGVAHLKRPLFFLPMDNVLWTGWEQLDHPMRKVDNPVYSSPRRAMEELARHARALGGSLVIKRHPACLAINEHSVPDDALFVDGDLTNLLAAADVVVTFNTKVAFPALALGRPVVTLAPNPAAASGSTYHCLDRNRVRQTLQEALNQEGLDSKLKQFPPFVGWLALEFFYDCRDDTASSHRGPRQFVEDLISAADKDPQPLDDAQLRALAVEVSRLAGATSSEQAKQVPSKSPKAKASSVEETSSPSLARRARIRVQSSLPGKALRVLRQEGLREMVRKTVVWTLPRMGHRVLSIGASILERAGIRIDELKARLPYLVQYRQEWSPAKAAPYSALFRRLWLSPLPTDSELPGSGCSETDVERLKALESCYQGRLVWILEAAEISQAAALAQRRGVLTLGVDETLLETPESELDFCLVMNFNLANKIRERLESTQKTRFFLPLSLFGLVPPDRRVFWFGTCLTSSETPSNGDIATGVFRGNSAREVATELARFLGCTIAKNGEPPTVDATSRASNIMANGSMKRKERIVIDFDVKRLVDASVTRKPYQGITRYTLRLFERLKTFEDEVLIRPVYLHPLSPQRIGIEKAVTETSGLDAVAELFGEDVSTRWNRHKIAGTLMRFVNGLERRYGGETNRVVGQIIHFFQRCLIPHNFQASNETFTQGNIFHSPVNPLPPKRLTKDHLRVVTIHDCIFLKFSEFYPIPGRVPAIRKTLDSIDPTHDFVICDSENSRRDLHSFLEIDEQRTTVVPLAADAQFYQPDTKRAQELLRQAGVTPGDYFIALAQSEPRKNIPTMVEAYLRFLRDPATRSPASLVLVTWESYREKLMDDLQTRGLGSESIRIITEVDDAALSGLYAMALALIYVPLYEGFGIPPLEAMAAGCPVISANNSSLPEVVGAAGIYVDAECTESITSALTTVSTDATRRDELVDLGHKQAARFSWERTARMTLDFYREMLETRDST